MTQRGIEILDPVGEVVNAGLTMAPRLRDLRGTRLGVLDTQWRSFGMFLDKLVPRLRDEFELLEVVTHKVRWGKPSVEAYSRPEPDRCRAERAVRLRRLHGVEYPRRGRTGTPGCPHCHLRHRAVQESGRGDRYL